MNVLIEDLCAFLDQLAPQALATEWDNTGLLVGRPERPVSRVMTCLTVTAEVLREAIQNSVQLLVTHHPIPFRPLKVLNAKDNTSRRLLELIEARIAVYSLHTRWDSAQLGINQTWAERLELHDIQPLIEHPGHSGGPCGAGRCGRVMPAQPAWQLLQRVMAQLSLPYVWFTGSLEAPVERLAIACGAGDDFLSLTAEADCQLLITGEVRFHTAVEAELIGIGLVAVGHYASERWGIEHLANILQEAFPQLDVWASRSERDSWHHIRRSDLIANG